MAVFRQSHKNMRYVAILAIAVAIASAVVPDYTKAVSIESEPEPELPATNPPWHDSAILEHVEQKRFAGTLNSKSLQSLVRAGEVLFTAKFELADGVGRPMATQAIIPTKRKRPPRNEFSRTAGLDANACSSCHNDPSVGGAGDFAVNVFVSEGFQLSDFDSTDPQFSNERNTNHLFGAGLVELLAREMTASLQQQRHEALSEARDSNSTVRKPLVTKGVQFGELVVFADGRVDMRQLAGVDDDLIVKPFSQKGVMTSLRQFTINALNHHHGMQATERFGSRWTGSDDFDEDGKRNEIVVGDVSALVAFQASLKPPMQRQLPQDWAQAAARGSELFDVLECSTCHIRALPLDSLQFSDPGPFDAAGTLRSDERGTDENLVYDLAMFDWADRLERNAKGQWMVPLFGDLKRHVIADSQVAVLGNELLSQRFVERNEFMTSELWGVGSTAPYGHRGI